MTIKCPYCGRTVTMDWHCEKCQGEIAYDIDDNLVRSNPHIPGHDRNVEIIKSIQKGGGVPKGIKMTFVNRGQA